MDGAFKVSISGMGGIVRDHNGVLIAAVGFYDHVTTPLEAQIHAALKVLTWCIAKGYSQLMVETDSAMLAQMVRSKKAHRASINNIAHICHLVDSSGSTLSYIYREQNMAANWVAKEAMQGRSNRVWEPPDEPLRLRALLALECQGVPYIQR
ncbi:hypothetical protein LIER_25139 [Lithospermum erythrorhizon]|uniref:RNase H type-1 domain-containing protein n=1 Tax=Lithospermum erythrorhizon TaxID=34254 RepID=A0AAV3R6U0_LITER